MVLENFVLLLLYSQYRLVFALTEGCSYGVTLQNGCLVSVVSFEQEAKSKQEKSAEIKRLAAEMGTIKR